MRLTRPGSRSLGYEGVRVRTGPTGQVGGVVSVATRGARQAAIDAQVVRGDPGDLLHALFTGERLALAEAGEKPPRRTVLDVPRQVIPARRACTDPFVSRERAVVSRPNFVR